MSDMAGRSGGCLCGAVRFTLEKAPRDVSICHCGMCRRHSGGPAMAVHGVGAVTIENEDAVTWFASSDWGRRGFCSTCGSTLFWRMADGSETVVGAGALDTLDDLEIESHIFADQKPGFYDFADDKPRLSEAETIALFTGGAQGEGA